MITKSSVQYSPFINLKVKIITQNLDIEGLIVFESQQILEIKCKFTQEIKQILKSSIDRLFFYDEDKSRYIEISNELVRGDLIYRLKKMK